MIRPTTRNAALVISLVLASLVASTATAAPRIDAKRAEAERVLAQVQQIDAQLDLAVDAYNGAQIEFEAIEDEQRLNRRHLRIARANYKKAQAAVARRLIALYKEGDAPFVEFLLGSRSVGELVDRLDTVDRVSEQDVRIIEDIVSFRQEIRRHERELRRARAKQQKVVRELATRREAIEGQLAERQRLLSTIQDQIGELEAEEAARQRRLAAQAEARLAAQTPLEELASQVPSPQGLGATPPPARYGGVVAIALQYLGIPYLWAGASPTTGFDCSGFIMYVFAQMGVSLPHNAAAQYGYGTPVARDQLEPGDLVFFNGLGHNGIYIGAGQFIHSPHTGDVVKISGLSEAWYAATYVGARRL